MVSTLGHRALPVAIALAALAGYVDAMGFITLNGFFVSFMSGNSTRMAVSFVDGDLHPATVGAAVIGLFVLGVVAGSLLGRRAGDSRRSVVLIAVAATLTVAAVGQGFGAREVVIAAMALAMGAENTVFERSGEAPVSLTYMTGTLVKLGQAVADAVTGGPRWAWGRFAVLWLGLVLGVCAGAVAHRAIGLSGLWIAVGVALALAVITARVSGART